MSTLVLMLENRSEHDFVQVAILTEFDVKRLKLHLTAASGHLVVLSKTTEI